MNIMPCLTWVRRGVAKNHPDKVQLDKEELRKIIEETKEDIDNVEDVLEDDSDDDSEETPSNNDAIVKAQKTKGKVKKKRKFEDKDSDDIVKKYGLEDYDEEDEGSNPLKGIGNLTYYGNNDEDPYITLKNEGDSDDEDNDIQPTDNLIVVGKAEGDSCVIEVHVYNEEYGNLFVHHDILLSSFPLCVEWMNYDAADEMPGNFVAVGTMDPVIEVWDLDVVDSLEPAMVLGTKKSSKKKKKKKSEVVGHTDAVLDLSWNSNVRNVLASASADFTLGLWDMSEGKVVTSITQHQEKVQCVKWHPVEAQTLLSGSFDNTVKVYDCRNPNENCKTWKLNGEIECVMWDTYSPLNFFASTDSGIVYYLDSRTEKPLYTLSAHTKAITGLAQSSSIKGLLTTCSTDKMFKVWDVLDNKPSLVMERNLKRNELLCAGACPDAPFVFAIGGEKELKVWDIRESAAVRNHFKSRVTTDVVMDGDGDIEDEETMSAMEALNIDPDEAEYMASLEQPSEQGATAIKKKKKKKKNKAK